jgi:uncharacterized protein (DUF305 family)
MKHVRGAALAGGTLALSLVLSACGGSGDTTDTTASGGMNHSGSSSAVGTAPEHAAEDHNAADVEFAQLMIVHHRGAIEMTEMAGTRAASPEVKDLAKSIQAAQEPEIQTMSGWLETWGEEVPEGTTPVGGSMGHGGGSMPGMMSEHDMAALEAASGAEFDRMFLEGMTEHHEGAISMAQTEQAEGKYAEAVALAEKIETDQTAEIEEMRGLQGAL